MKKKTIPESPCTTVSKQVSLGQNHSHEIKFDLHENEPEGGSHFHVNAVSHSAKIRFDKEAKGDSEMACDFLMFPGGGDVLAISSLALHLMSHVHEYNL